LIGDVLIVLVALIHVYIVILEMLLWDTERGRRAFGTTPAFAAQSRVMAANQGLYNAFLVAGLAWSLWPGGGGEPARIFFLSCIVIAGLYGGWTVGRRVLLIQAIPAAAALLAVLLRV
jgi:putative membrane protein